MHVFTRKSQAFQTNHQIRIMASLLFPSATLQAAVSPLQAENYAGFAINFQARNKCRATKKIISAVCEKLFLGS